jgi:septum formation inhibitor-activating ATPase MinD
MTRLDKHSDIRHEDIEQVLGAPLACTFPSDYRTTMAALNKGRPLVLDNHSRLAASFEQFARMLGGPRVETKGEAQPGWLDRLTSRKRRVVDATRESLG